MLITYQGKETERTFMLTSKIKEEYNKTIASLIALLMMMVLYYMVSMITFSVKHKANNWQKICHIKEVLTFKEVEKLKR